MTAFNKIDRPPAVENWSRLQHQSVDRTALEIFRFLRGAPAWNYQTGRKAAKFYFEDRIDREAGLKIASSFGNAIGRPHNVEFVKAFFDHVEEHPIEGVKAFDEMVEWFPLRRGVAIPVKPLAVIRECGEFTPIFLCPWSRIAFDEFQSSLFMTILEKAVFTLTDFENSQGKVLFFPRTQTAEGRFERQPVAWVRGKVPLLSQ